MDNAELIKKLNELESEVKILRGLKEKTDLAPKIITEANVCFIVLEYEFDDSKTIVLGQSKKIGAKQNLTELHENMYLELLSSLRNVVNITMKKPETE